MSIRKLLFTIIGCFIALSAIFSLREFQDSLKKYQSANFMLIANKAVNDLYVGTGNLAFERGIIRSLIESKRVINPILKSIARERQKLAEVSIKQALDIIQKYDFYSKDELYSKFHDKMTNAILIRKKVDKKLKSYTEKHNEELANEWFTAATELIVSVKDIAFFFSITFRDFNKEIRNYTESQKFLWEVTEYAGREQAIIVGKIIKKQHFTRDNIEKLSYYRGIVDISWDNAEKFISGGSASLALQEKFKIAKTLFFSDFEKIRDDIYRAGLVNENSYKKTLATATYPLSLKEWFSSSTKVIDTISTLNQNISLEANYYIEEISKESKERIIFSIVFFILGASFCGYSLWIAKQKIIHPINTLVTTMNTISSGDLEAKLPTFKGENEISIMADSIRIFRNNFLRIKRLEVESAQRIILSQVNEMLEKTIQDRTKKLKDESLKVKLLKLVAEISNEAETASEAIYTCIKEICEYSEWVAGHAYIYDKKNKILIPMKEWYISNLELLEIFEEISKDDFLENTEGLPKRILKNKLPLWIKNIKGERNFPYEKYLLKTGIKSSFGFPVILNGDVVAIMEFFSINTILPDEKILEIVSFTGIQLSRVIEREKTERALNENKERIHAIIDNTVDGILTTDKHGIIQTFNHCCEKIFGYTSKEMVGKNLNILVPQPSRKKHNKTFKKYLKRPAIKGVSGFHREVKGLHKEGFTIDLDIAISEVYIDDTLIFTSIVRNITEQKLAKEQLAKTIQELTRSNTELERFAYIASHDLREPLRTISSYSQLLKRNYGNILDEKGKQFLNYTTDATEHMKTLVTDLLSYSRLNPNLKTFKETNCNEAIKHAIENLDEAIYDSDAEITFDPLPTVIADRTQIIRLFQNLIGNAIKYRNKDKPLKIHISTVLEKNNWKFSVQDNGIGIEEEYLEQIFIIFKQLHTKKEYPGTGIGLAICQKVIENHNGHIWAESDYKNGSVFYFTIPVFEI